MSNDTQNDNDTQPKGIYGATLTTKMMRDLDWHSWRILDFFHNIWKTPGAKVFITNARLAKELGVSTGTIKRALTTLKDTGFITCTYQADNSRIIIPGGKIVHSEPPASEQNTDSTQEGGGSNMIHPRIKSDPPSDHIRSTLGSQMIHIKPINIKLSKSNNYGSDQTKSEPPSDEDPDKVKTPCKTYPQLWFSKEEQDRLVSRYQREDLDLREALELFDTWASDNPKKFKSKKSHYRCMIGWVLDEMRKREASKVRLEASRIFADTARRKSDDNR